MTRAASSQTFLVPKCSLILFLVMGCGSGVKVEGTVSFNGTPVEGAKVTLMPLFEGAPTDSVLTDARGGFVSGAAMPPGEYAVLVEKYERLPGADLPVVPSGPAPARPDLFSVKRKPILPLRYGDPASSPFRCKVPLSSPLRLELTDKR